LFDVFKLLDYLALSRNRGIKGILVILEWR